MRLQRPTWYSKSTNLLTSEKKSPEKSEIRPTNQDEYVKHIKKKNYNEPIRYHREIRGAFYNSSTG